jgi:serine phosphatase RsbU (regulator of sigma subunit)
MVSIPFAPSPGVLDWAVAAAALPGETECGDAYLVRPLPNGVLLAVVDGLGHGAEAAAVARRALSALSAADSPSVIALTRRCHASLAGTRGVVMSLAVVSGEDDTVSWLGVGNVQGALLRADRAAAPHHEVLLARNGVVGLQLPRLRASVTSIARGDLVLLATDGIEVGFLGNLRSAGSPQELADRILAKHTTGTDDALVLVGRYRTP